MYGNGMWLFLSCSAEMDVVAASTATSVATTASRFLGSPENLPWKYPLEVLHALLEAGAKATDGSSQAPIVTMLVTSSVCSLIASVLLFFQLYILFKLPFFTTVPDVINNIIGLISNILWIATFIFAIIGLSPLIPVASFQVVLPSYVLLVASVFFTVQSVADLIPASKSGLFKSMQTSRLGNKIGITMFFSGALLNVIFAMMAPPSDDALMTAYWLFLPATVILLCFNYNIFGLVARTLGASSGNSHRVTRPALKGFVLIGPLLLFLGSVFLLKSSTA